MPPRQPVRIIRTRKRFNVTPAGAVYVGKPTLWNNPFARGGPVGHARSVIMYDAWLRGDLTYHILDCAGFNDDEMEGLARLRGQVLASMHLLTGRDLQCWCPLTSAWCHAGVLLRHANNLPWLHEMTARAA